MLLKKSIVDLVSKTGASQARLWGKIRGTKKDYYIVEGHVEKGEGDEEADPDAEGRGAGNALEIKGINEYVYWAANNAYGPWTQLPDLKPKDIMNARGIKHTFCGDLDAKIFTNPFFLKNLLSCAQLSSLRCSECPLSYECISTSAGA